MPTGSGKSMTSAPENGVISRQSPSLKIHGSMMNSLSRVSREYGGTSGAQAGAKLTMPSRILTHSTVSRRSAAYRAMTLTMPGAEPEPQTAVRPAAAKRSCMASCFFAQWNRPPMSV